MKTSFLLLSFISLALVGCQSPSSVLTNPLTTDTNSAASTTKTVVASFYPLAFMTEQIVGNEMAVVNLAGASDVHDYEPSPQDMVQLHKADLLVYLGAELEPWAEDVVPTLENKTLEVAHALTLAEREVHDDHEEAEHEDEPEDDHDEEASEEVDHDEHDHGQFDPHVWLDPVLAQQMVDEILEAVLEIDATKAAVYTANAATLKGRFKALDSAFESGLNACAQQEVIVSHDAYGYLARRYGFQTHAISGLSTQDEPSAKILAALKAEADEGITHILSEENNVLRFAEMLSSETGLEMVSINPLGRGTLDPSKDFFDVMTENLASLETALECK